ncbi:hypothetical protein DdX_17356 [Ditylenchus destructor]|uniref:Uncharacterized protein n=1 Tax=Ditylenchus destructor TaxID=166010 RepID=A0AAD4MRJ2_9BILA|nr:hypothetical protein DdX_17356 [Ditylenchus destructor]
MLSRQKFDGQLKPIYHLGNLPSKLFPANVPVFDNRYQFFGLIKLSNDPAGAEVWKAIATLAVQILDDILNIGGNLEKYSKEIYGNVLELNRTDKNNETAFLDLYIKSLALAEEYIVGLPITLVPISFTMNQNASDKLLHERNNLSEKQAKNNFGQNMEISDINSKVDVPDFQPRR